MTLKEKLMKKRNNAISMKPVETAEEIWKCIASEFDGFTGLELKKGNIACVDVEQEDDKIILTKSIGGVEERVILTGKKYIQLGEKISTANIIEILKKVIELAKKESVHGWKVENDNEDCSYNAWGFDINFD